MPRGDEDDYDFSAPPLSRKHRPLPPPSLGPRAASSGSGGLATPIPTPSTSSVTRPMTAVSGAGYGAGDGGGGRRPASASSMAGGDPHHPAAFSSSLAASSAAALHYPGASSHPPTTGGGDKASTAILVAKQDDSPEAMARTMERQVHALLEASALAAKAGHMSVALDKAKEAQRKERALGRAREQYGFADTVNGELTYAVALHLGSTYERSGMGDEALQVYQGLVKQRAALPPVAGWVRLNMGNVHYRQQRYAQAVKMYRMALDQIPASTHKATRLKVYRNLGHAFVRLGQLPEAVQAYEMVVLNPSHHPEGGVSGGGEAGATSGLQASQGGGGPHGPGSSGSNVLAQSSAFFSSSSFGLTSPHVVVFGDYFHTAFNLLLCYYALGQTDKMKRAFVKMVSTISSPSGLEEEEEEEEEEDAADPDTDENEAGRRAAEDLRENAAPASDLREEMRRRRKEAAHYLLQAAKLIAPVLDAKGDWNAGYCWVVEALRRGNHDELSSQMELERGLAFLRDKQFDTAVDVLKTFEKKDPKVKALAATNLSFIYYLEGDLAQAEAYADVAIRHNRYHATALVNKANCLFQRGEVHKAKALYLEAVGVEADCLEAIFNLGLANLHLGLLNESQQAYEKLHTLIPSCPEVLYQLGHLAEAQGQLPQAIKWFQVLLLGLNSHRGGKSGGGTLADTLSSSASSSGASSSLVAPSPAGGKGGNKPSSSSSHAAAVTVDDGLLTRLGRLYHQEGNDAQALHYFLESDRVNPYNVEALSWLGVWHVRQEEYDDALRYFSRAARLQPHEPQWGLMQASCHRRIGDFVRALEMYQRIHAEHPEDADCLRYLVTLCRDLGRPWEGYQQRLLQLEQRSSGDPQHGLLGLPPPPVGESGAGRRKKKKAAWDIGDVDVGSLLI